MQGHGATCRSRLVHSNAATPTVHPLQIPPKVQALGPITPEVALQELGPRHDPSPISAKEPSHAISPMHDPLPIVANGVAAHALSPLHDPGPISIVATSQAVTPMQLEAGCTLGSEDGRGV